MNDLNWKIYHHGLVTESLAKVFNVGDGKCHICGEEETLEHAIFECKYVKDLWSKCKMYLVQVHGLHNNTDMKKLAISGLDYNDVTSESNFCITSFMKYTIWNIRNSVVFDKIRISTHSYITQLKCCLLSWVTTLYYLHKQRGKVATFVDKFSKWVEVENNTCALKSVFQQK